MFWHCRSISPFSAATVFYGHAMRERVKCRHRKHEIWGPHDCFAYDRRHRGTAAHWLRHIPVARAGAAGDRGTGDGSGLPASIPAQDLVGRWGLAAYHKEEDRSRTEAAARGQCKQPYNISRGPRGGVIMHLPDQPQPTELSLKGGPDGKTTSAPARSPLAVRATVRS